MRQRSADVPLHREVQWDRILLIFRCGEFTLQPKHGVVRRPVFFPLTALVLRRKGDLGFPPSFLRTGQPPFDLVNGDHRHRPFSSS
jgi:hypothetical protein